MKVKWSIETGYPTASHRGEWEVGADTTDQELDEMLQDELNNHISATWWKE